MGDPTKLVLGELINDLVSEERILTELRVQDLTNHLLEATVFFKDEPKPRWTASGTIEHIGFGTQQALITFRGKANGDESSRLHQLSIGTDGVEDYSQGHRVEIKIYNAYKNQGE